MAAFLTNNRTTFTALQVIIAAICIFIPLIFRSYDKDNYFPVIIHPKAVDKIASCTSSVQMDTTTDGRRADSIILRMSICGGDSLIDGVNKVKRGRYGFRSSISEYVYMSKSNIFGLFYCMAAMFFIFNGAVYLNNIQLEKAQLAGRRPLVINKNGSWYNILIGISLLGVVFFSPYDSWILHHVFTFLFFIFNFIVLAIFPNKGESRASRILRVIVAVTIVSMLIWLLVQCYITVLVAEWFSLAVISLHAIWVAISVNQKFHEGLKSE